MQGFVHIEQNLAFFVFGGDRLAGGISFSPYKPKSVIRISLCRTAKRNPNDRFGINNDEWSFLIRERPLIKKLEILYLVLFFLSLVSC